MAENPAETGGVMGNIDGIERPDWGAGGEVRSPASAQPSRGGEQGFADKPVTEGAPATTEQKPSGDKYSADGKEVVVAKRKDWDGSEAQPQAEDHVQLPTENADVAVGLGPDLVSRWEREGGFQHNLAQAQATATKVLSFADDPDGMTASFDKLPSELQSKIIDNLRLSAPYGENGATLRLEAIVSQCSSAEVQALQSWWNGLTERQQDAVFAGLSK
jgi:hypothetical protein